MESFDYIIAGGGCAGLSLAWRLQRSTLSNKRILIIEQEAKNTNDRTWCFWLPKGSRIPFSNLIQKSWDRLTFAGPRGGRTEHIAPYQYHLIRSQDFYAYIHKSLEQSSNIQFRRASIKTISADQGGAYVQTDSKTYRSEYVFNSIPSLAPPLSGNRHFIQQHFLGWFIKTPKPVFTPDQMTLMDFRASQDNGVCFFYVLPFDSSYALVECTYFSPNLLPKEHYREQVRKYLDGQMGVDHFHIEEEEFGCIPMADGKRISPDPRIILTGTAGGAVKPTTGYAFLRIQDQVSNIVQTLEEGVRPKTSKVTKQRFAFYDQLLLHILEKEPQMAVPIFERLFKQNTFPRVLKFLNEQTTLPQEAQIFASLPKKPFLQALINTSVSLPGRKKIPCSKHLGWKNPSINSSFKIY